MGYMHVMCVFQKCSKNILSAKMCVEIATYILHVVCMECASPKMFVEIFSKFLKYPKVCCFYFFKDSANLHRNIYYMLYAWNVRVFENFQKVPKRVLKYNHILYAICMKFACLENFQKKILSPKICVDIFMRISKVSKSVLFFSFLKDSAKYRSNI